MSSSKPTVPPLHAARRTQRAPKSCQECFRRKIRCDKILPCRPCSERGDAVKCQREIVNVKGKLIGVDADLGESSFKSPAQEIAWLREKCARLQQENAQLAARLDDDADEVASDRAIPEAPESENDIQRFAPTLHNLTLGLGYEAEGEDDEELRENGLIEVSSSAPKYVSRRTSVLNSLVELPIPSFDANDRSTMLLRRLTRHQAQHLIIFHFERISWIHCALHGPNFINEHDTFRTALDYGTYKTDHLWNALLLAILSSSLFYLDRECAADLLSWPDEELDQAPREMFDAALESLQAAEFMKHPHIRTVQTFCVLSLCLPVFGSLHFQYALLNSVIYISQSLNLHLLEAEKTANQSCSIDESFIDREIGRRLYWTIIIMDGMAPTWRIPSIGTKTFNTALPGNFNDANLFVGSDTKSPKPQRDTTIVSYHIVLSKIALYKKALFSLNINEKASILTLKKTEEALDRIIAELPPGLDSTLDHPTPDPDVTTWFQRYLLGLHLRLERLYIRLAPYNGERDPQWQKESRAKCLLIAAGIVEDLQEEVPALFTKNWSVVADAVYTGLFYILDLRENPTSRDTSGHLKAVEIISNFLEDLRHCHVIAARGVALLHRLKSLSVSHEPANNENQDSASMASALYFHRLLERARLQPSGLARGPKAQPQDVDPAEHDDIQSWETTDDLFYNPLWDEMNEIGGNLFTDDSWLVDPDAMNF